MDGNGICNIGRNKSDIRNTKNQNFEISESWNDVSPEANVFYLKQNIILADGLVTLKLIRVAHGRSNFCFHKTNSKVVKSNFKVLQTISKVVKSNFKVLQTIFKVVKTNFNVGKTISKVVKTNFKTPCAPRPPLTMLKRGEQSWAATCLGQVACN